MGIIIYSDFENKHLQSLTLEIEKHLECSPVIVNEINHVFQERKEKVSSHPIFIFLISLEKELYHLASSKEKLFASPFIIILPNNSDGLVAKALQFQPRYIGFDSDDFKDVCLVIEKMMLKKNKMHETKCLT